MRTVNLKGNNMKKISILLYFILGIGLVGCSNPSDEKTREGAVTKTYGTEAAGPSPAAPKPETVSALENDHRKISFDGYRIGDKFEDKGYKGHPFVHHSPQYHTVEWNRINKLSILTLEDGTIAAISKTYFVDRLKDFVGQFSIKSNVTLKPVAEIMGVANMYRGAGKDLLVEITTAEPSKYIESINDMAGQIAVDVTSPVLMKKLDAEIEAQKRAALQKAAKSFEF